MGRHNKCQSYCRNNWGFIKPPFSPPNYPRSLSLTIIAAPTIYSSVGETILYTYTITNTGLVGIPAPFVLSDNRFGIIHP